MPIFRKAEVVILKDDERTKNELSELTDLYARASGDVKEQIAKKIQYVEYGLQGENEILYQLKYADMDMVILRDLYIESDGLSAQIDYLVLTPKLNYIIECKNLYGNIKINANGDFIRSISYNGKTVKEGIPSPITQNERHLLVLNNADSERFSKIVGAINRAINKRFNQSLIVLSNSKTILDDSSAPKEIKNKVIRADNLAATIKKYSSEVKQAGLSRKDLLETGKSYLQLHTEKPSKDIMRFKALVESQEEEKKKKAGLWVCPRCGKHLVRRKGKNGVFIGCTGYPQCTYTRPYYYKRGE